MMKKNNLQIKKYTPRSGLRDYVQCYWVLNCCGRDVRKDFFPLELDGGLNIVFNLSDPIECKIDESSAVTMDKDFLIGSLARSLRIKPSGGVSLFAISFTPEGLYPFFSMPPVDLSDFCVEIEEIWELNGLGLSTLIHNTNSSFESLIQTFEEFFFNRMNNYRRHSLNVEKAVGIIRSHKGKISVETMANRLGISSRQLERKFMERIGIPPKQLCKIFRIKNVLIHLKANRYDLASLAIESGYFDQSHFIHEFRFFTGHSPAAYLTR